MHLAGDQPGDGLRKGSGSGALSQLFATRVAARRLQQAGILILVAGLAVLLLAGAASLLPLVLASALIAGAGQGLAFMGAVRHANQIAPKDAHAVVSSAFYLASYLGIGIPVIGVGLLATVTTISTLEG